VVRSGLPPTPSRADLVEALPPWGLGLLISNGIPKNCKNQVAKVEDGRVVYHLPNRGPAGAVPRVGVLLGYGTSALRFAPVLCY
jgi:hypothetical protein